jgi:hypothetical protein
MNQFDRGSKGISGGPVQSRDARGKILSGHRDPPWGSLNANAFSLTGCGYQLSACSDQRDSRGIHYTANLKILKRKPNGIKRGFSERQISLPGLLAFF